MNLGCILELRRGCPFQTGVCSVKSRHLSRYDGYLGNLSEAWRANTDASGGESGGQVPLISYYSYIAIPINFHEESGIVNFRSIELSATLDVSKVCESLSPEEVEKYGFL